MSLREDIRVQIKEDWHPKVPNEKMIIQQVKTSLKHGKSSGSIKLDISAMKEEQER